MSSIPSGTKFSLFLPQQVESCLDRCCFVWHQFLRFSKETGRREARNDRGQLRKTPVSEVQFKAALPSTRAARRERLRDEKQARPGRANSRPCRGRHVAPATPGRGCPMGPWPVARYVSLLRGCDSGRRILLPVPAVAVTERHFPRTFP
jgi:hypothetical protein